MFVRLYTLIALCCAISACAGAATLSTELTVEDLDAATFTQWVDGRELPMPCPPTHGVWTRATMPGWDGVTFGEGNTPGPRYLRVGFTHALPVATVLVRGGARVSVLKSTAAYPGNLADDTQWLPAQRLDGRRVSDEEGWSEQYLLWVLPPGTSTRALRFSHLPDVTENKYAGWVGGVYLLGTRVANVAAQATAITNARPEAAERIINGTNNNTWNAWDNGEQGAAQPLSAAHPEYIQLVWPKPVTLAGLWALWAGFGAVEVQQYIGPDTRPPSEAEEEDWQTVKDYAGLNSLYPLALGVNTLEFPEPITTRALRLRITGVVPESHPHLQQKTQDGKRVWLGQLCALKPLGTAPLDSALLPLAAADLHPPIPIRFHLANAGYVTLVIDGQGGRRIRNLVSETFFPAGDNVAWWDGLDDLGRDTEAAHHGIYHVPGTFVTPGSYSVHGLFHKEVTLHYEFSLYNAGSPAWMTADSTGGWLTNHTPPSSACFVPGERAPGGQPLVYLGSYVSEGGHGLAWVNLDGRKQGGVNWVGGTWTGAPYLACDTGPAADHATTLYAGAAWDNELRLTALTTGGDKAVLKYTFPDKEHAAISGLAVYNNLLACALPKMQTLLLVDTRAGRVLATLPLPDPRGVYFNADGRLLALSGAKLLYIPYPNATAAGNTVVIDHDLDDPQHVTCDSAGNYYITDRGASHQVKVFSPRGALLRAIGHAGAPKAGPYDPLRMQNPNGLTIDSRNHLWVAETDYQPKRVSVWTLDGQQVAAYYGPSEYGGGGVLEPSGKSFIYHGMEFALDWAKGTNHITRVLYRPETAAQKQPDGYGAGGMPETPITVNGVRYYTNCFNSNPTGGAAIAMLWVERDGVAVPAAAIGRANDWTQVKTLCAARWPAGLDPNGNYWQNQAYFVWDDMNGDGIMQPEEVQIFKGSLGAVTVMPDLSMVASRIDGATVRFLPQRFTTAHVPVYDLQDGQVLARNVQSPASSGGDQALALANGWTLLTVMPKPFSTSSICGVFQGTPLWSYPNMWPGLHASHESPTPEMPGELIGVTRLLGNTIDRNTGDAGPLWCLNSNMGCMYLFTCDGLFVSTLFHDSRMGRSWSMPTAVRGMRMNEVSCSDENFWPSITQTDDGRVYLIDGDRTSLVRVDGLETLSRLPAQTLRVTAQQLKLAQQYFLQQEIVRRQALGLAPLRVAMRPTPPHFDNKLGAWAQAPWVTIDRSGVAAFFNSNSKPYNVRAAVAVAGDRLFVAYETGDAQLLKNSGTVANALFKTGGALDLMLGVDPQAAPERADPVEGDVRLLVTTVDGKTRALLYRAVVPGTEVPVPFSSPWHTITLDQVEDVSAQVTLDGADGNYQFSIPLATLRLRPEAGLRLKGDVGILRGDGFQTLQRVYWSNKATGITADVPSEAMLTPALWGNWQFVNGG